MHVSILKITLHHSIYFIARGIDGEVFVTLSREDIAVIFPEKQKFVTGVKLYQEIKRVRKSCALGDDDDDSGRAERTNCESTSRQRDSVLGMYSLPKFSPDIERAIKKDNFHTSVLRNKLIREACRSLKGHCQKECRPPIPAEKRRLGKMLFNLAPKSLGDPEGLAVTGVPEVHMFNYIFALLRHIYTMIKHPEIMT